MDWKTTSTILDRLLDAGDDAMWRDFNDRFHVPLIRFAARMGLPNDAAEDVSQETLLAFAQAFKAGKYDRSLGRLSSWLFGIAYRQAALALRKHIRDHRKRDGRAAHTSFLDNVPAETEATHIWDREWEQAAVEKCLTQLKAETAPHQFEAFHRIVYQSQPPDEVAAALNMTRNAAYVAKHRCLKRLGELVQEFTEWRTSR